jgi:hypothetical protein
MAAVCKRKRLTNCGDLRHLVCEGVLQNPSMASQAKQTRVKATVILESRPLATFRDCKSTQIMSLTSTVS